MYAVLSLLILVATVGALVDIIRIDSGRVRHLPKLGWALLVLFAPLIGTALWFGLGREWLTSPRAAIGFGDPRRWSRDTAQPTQPRPAADTRSTEQQLADLEREIEFYDRMHRRDPDSTPST